MEHDGHEEDHLHGYTALKVDIRQDYMCWTNASAVFELRKKRVSIGRKFITATVMVKEVVTKQDPQVR